MIFFFAFALVGNLLPVQRYFGYGKNNPANENLSWDLLSRGSDIKIDSCYQMCLVSMVGKFWYLQKPLHLNHFLDKKISFLIKLRIALQMCGLEAILTSVGNKSRLDSRVSSLRLYCVEVLKFNPLTQWKVHEKQVSYRPFACYPMLKVSYWPCCQNVSMKVWPLWGSIVWCTEISLPCQRSRSMG